MLSPVEPVPRPLCDTPCSSSGGRAAVLIPRCLSWLPASHLVCSLDTHFRRRDVLGRGGTSTVYAAQGLRGSLKGQMVALKLVSRKNAHAAVYVNEEVLALQVLKHPGVVQFKGLFVDHRHFAIITEMGSISLFDAVRHAPKRRLSERRAQRVCFGLLRTLSWLHAKRIAHRDIKLENVVFLYKDRKKLRNPKIVDWAAALPCEDPYRKVTDGAGTRQYKSPEKFRAHEAWEAMAADVWSVGVCAYEMLTGRECFGGDRETVQRRVLDNRWSFPRSVPLSPNAEHFVRFLLTFHSDKRPTAERCLAHPWLAELSDTP